MYQRFYLTCFITFRNKTIAASNITGALVSKDGRRYAHYHHAESRALRKALAKGFDLTKSTVVVVRDKPSGGFGMAKPCGRCMRLLLQLGVQKKRISWTTND